MSRNVIAFQGSNKTSKPSHILLVFVWALGLTLAGCSSSPPAPSSSSPPAPSSSSPPAPSSSSPSGAALVQGDTFSYPGKDGKTALELLKVAANNGLEMQGDGQSAFVVAINGRKASKDNHEFWELSLNGTPASVGAGSLVTHDGDLVEWKIKKF